jgi:hypothetical protein
MYLLRPRKAALLLGLFVGVISCGGCGASDPTPALKAAVLRANSTNSKRLATLYSRYHARFFSGPRDEPTFKKFIADRPVAELEELGASSGDIDALFVSERDKRPFFIRYGLSLTDARSRAIVLETEGLNGKALVLFGGTGGIREAAVPSAELEDYRTGKKDEE